jgi:hypothetical protein
MKDYKKIYKRLVKEIEKEAERIPTLSLHESGNNRLLEQIENNSQTSALNWVLSMLSEIEGKKCNLVLMNEKEFKQWKKKIKV